ncbi:restriction endonuclease-like protein [Oceanobacillus sp. FSL K6-3682]|uniref:restriction endonuclease-like protein n=1 Tax=Oceanobacillus sp. FSL K6-3682 TaxID=2921503 RepID=UPI0030D73FBB
MASLHSGSAKDDVELLHIDTKDMTIVIKGKPYHEKYEGLSQYRKMDYHDPMNLTIDGENIESIQVFDIDTSKLMAKYSHRPIFFENGIYQLIVSPKDQNRLSFYHEHQGLRNAVDKVSIGDSYILMGNLQFQNEVGLSTFEIRDEDRTLITVTLEIFPTKLDYRNDYKQLLEEVNDEIYNLAYHFIKKTYLGAKAKLEGKPTKSEFYRLIQAHFDKLVQSIHQIEKQPHHRFNTMHKKVRGDQLGRQDHKARKYLRKRPHLLTQVDNGINIGGQSVMPTHGLNIRKEIIYDTYENRFIKWMMVRLIEKLDHLIMLLNKKPHSTKYETVNTDLIQMRKKLRDKVSNYFWRGIGELDRSVMSLVLQMAPGYRDSFQIYLLLSRGLALQGDIYNMSVKDVATLYEYWTYLKLGQLLGRKYEMIEQSVVEVNQGGLFVNLKPDTSAKRVFRHPKTQEKITLIYQKREKKLPTITQIPDTMLSIEKKGKDYEYQYVFDAKYRIDFALKGTRYGRNYGGIPGPMEEDINTMHRYRDSIVVNDDGPFERKAFGAYVLFPWDNEDLYQDHKLYKSIDEVNIGGLPFLPNATSLVERFIEQLIDKTPEEIQKEGILPRGTISEWKSSIDEKVMVINGSNRKRYHQLMQDNYVKIATNRLSKNWQEAKYLSLYITNDESGEKGVFSYAKIEEVKVVEEEVHFILDKWMKLTNMIQSSGYEIASYVLTSYNSLLNANELVELFMKSSEEETLWRILSRFSDRVTYELDNKILDKASRVDSFYVKDLKLSIWNQTLFVKRNGELLYSHPSKELMEVPSKVFKELSELIIR